MASCLQRGLALDTAMADWRFYFHGAVPDRVSAPSSSMTPTKCINPGRSLLLLEMFRGALLSRLSRA
ncbi:hypothetical protein [Nonomuraea sp. B19D2]|uniref:hypothetical protein n=1 Tax=Nonomuraea sp. B19D2 TaxID=3159561 RepID=UPI0032DA0EB4